MGGFRGRGLLAATTAATITAGRAVALIRNMVGAVVMVGRVIGSVAVISGMAGSVLPVFGSVEHGANQFAVGETV